MEIFEKLERLTKIKHGQIGRLDMIFYRLGADKKELFQAQKEAENLILEKTEKLNIKLSRGELAFCAFYQSVYSYSKLLLNRRCKQELNIDREKSEQQWKLRTSFYKHKVKRKPSKVKIIIEQQFFGIIKDLRELNMSWRNISDYIHKYHRKKISFLSLRNNFELVKKEIEEAKDLAKRVDPENTN